MKEKELYWKMYSKLFNTITDVLPLVENENASEILKQAQIETEAMYMDNPPSWKGYVKKCKPYKKMGSAGLLSLQNPLNFLA